MKIIGNDITIYRGQDLTIDYILVNKDGSPYIVQRSKQPATGIGTAENAYPNWLISISNTQFDIDNKYRLNYVLPLNVDASLVDITSFSGEAFDCTQPLDITSIKNAQGKSLYNDWSEMPTSATVDLLLSGYVNGKLVNITRPWECVFYLEKDGVREYKYAKYTASGGNYTVEYFPYQCRVTKFISSFITKQWEGMNYLYSISLIYCDANYDDVDKMLESIVNFIPVIVPSKLTVLLPVQKII